MAGARAWIGQVLSEAQPGDCINSPYTPNARYALVYLDGRMTLLHRAMCEAFTGEPIPEGLEVRHLCGWSRCVNPHHLKPGTHSENERDKRSHGTLVRGEAHHKARLSNDAVRDIRTSTESVHALARRMGVSRSTIRRARDGENWKHVA